MGAAGIVSFLQLGITCVATLLFFALNSTAYTVEFPDDNDICTSLQCQSVEDIFEKYVNPELDPCDDFSKFVCDKYTQDHVRKQSYGNGLDDSSELGLNRLQYLLSIPISNNDKILPSYAKQIYQSCINTNFDTNYMNQAVYRQLIRLGNWPLVTPDWSANTNNWIDVYRNGYYIGLPLYSLVFVQLTPPPGTYSDLMVSIRKGYVENLDDNGKQMIKDTMLGLLEANHVVTASDFNEQLEEAFDLHNKFSAIVSKEVDSTQSLKTIQELKSSCPDVDWLNLANIPYQNNVALQEHEQVLIFDEEVICDSLKLIENNERAIFNHIFIHIAEAFFELLKKYQANTELPIDEHKKECATTTLEIFAVGASLLYMEDRDFALGSFTRLYIDNLVNSEIRPELKIIIDNNTWINPEARTALLRKIDKIKLHLGFLEINRKFSDQIHIYEHIFKDAQISQDDILQNFVQINLKSLEALGKSRKLDFPVLVARYPTLANSVNANAWYIPNNILITYSLLTPLTYQYMGPSFHNYGGLASILGHEFSHSVDSEFFKVDENDKTGNFWSEESEKEFNDRVKCLIDAYNDEIDPCGEINVDGQKTVNENMADLHGIMIARRLYGKYLDKDGNEDFKIKTFNKYTPQQLFWISTALILCERRSKEKCLEFQKSDIHTIGPVRINMNAKMSPYFAQDFNCPENSPMNPSSRCKIY